MKKVLYPRDQMPQHKEFDRSSAEYSNDLSRFFENMIK